MAYTKTIWTNDTAPSINADNLNKIEQGVYDADVANTNVNNALELTEDSISEAQTITGWENGTFNHSTGGTYSTNAYIRLRNDFFSNDNVFSLTTKSGYSFVVFAYLKTDGSYVGALQADGTIAKNNNFKYNKRFLPGAFPSYKFKVALKNDTVSTIAPSEGTNFQKSTLVSDDIKNTMTSINNKIDSEVERFETKLQLMNIFEKETVTSRTVSTVVLTATSKSGHFEGTASSNAAFVLYNSTSAIPTWLEKGKKYTAGISPQCNISLRIQYYDSDGTAYIIKNKKTFYDFIIPNDAVGLRIDAFIAKNVSVNDTVIAVFSDSTQNELLLSINNQINEPEQKITKQYTNKGFFQEESFSIYDAFDALLKSVQMDVQATATRTYANTFQDVIAHGSIMQMKDDKMYCVFLANTDNTEDSPLDEHCQVHFSISDKNGTSVDSCSIIAKKGDSVGNKTISSGAGNPNCYFIDNILHILAAAKLNDDKWHLIHATFDTDNSTLSSFETCLLSVSGQVVDFTTDAVSEYIQQLGVTDTFVHLSSQISYHNGYYYTGMLIGRQIHPSVIMRTADFVTWEPWLIPEWSQNYLGQHEAGCYCYNNKIYYFMRLELAEERQNRRMLIAKIDISTKTIEQEYLIKDACARACWFMFNDKLYLMHSIENRIRAEVLEISPNDITDCRIAWQGLQEYIYPSIVFDSVSGIVYMSATAGGQNTVVLQHFNMPIKNLGPAINQIASLFVIN